MRRLFIPVITLAALLLWPLHAEAAWSHISGADICAQGINSATTTGVDTTGANTYFLSVVVFNSAGTPAITSSPSQTWTSDSSIVDSNPGTKTYLYRASGVTTSASQTFTSTLTGGLQSICVLSFSGGNTVSPKDQSSTFNAGSSTTHTYDSAITPSEDNEIIIANTDITLASTTVTINSGMSTPLQIALTNAVAYGVAMSYKIQTSAASIQPTWTYSNAVSESGNIVSYKAAAASAIISRRSNCPRVGSRCIQ